MFPQLAGFNVESSCLKRKLPCYKMRFWVSTCLPKGKSPCYKMTFYLKGLSTFNYGNFEILQSAVPDLCILTLEPAGLLPHCLGCGVDCGRVDLLGGVQCSVTTVREVEEDKVVLWLSGFKRVAIPVWCRGGWWNP